MLFSFFRLKFVIFRMMGVYSCKQEVRSMGRFDVLVNL